jgi:hypothetical protein
MTGTGYVEDPYLDRALQGMPDDLREDPHLRELIKAEDAAGIMTYIKARIEESLAEEKSFEHAHPELKRRWSRYWMDSEFNRSLPRPTGLSWTGSRRSS